MAKAGLKDFRQNYGQKLADFADRVENFVHKAQANGERIDDLAEKLKQLIGKNNAK
jgi:hypothetical protein